MIFGSPGEAERLTIGLIMLKPGRPLSPRLFS